ncbi:MAG: 16S rRNA (cytidine(1402)-2'-O)-methyltransferase [Fimbriimonadaceae bacterium]|nr:16S rRNA (cytidine(1402)-2'-O)-methyltransferase [Fimbriimonadaceae bacterium]QYK56395.1 MAG: 16S rRNA (cytidine(1402)-2'-O)-methyltransferase [Fimbriimonadaceae bacterium]
MAGRLVLVASPIGNLGDVSARAREELAGAEVWLVEDTRVAGRLQSALGISCPMRLLNDHTSERRLEEYAGLLEGGARAAVVTDAGCPVISDPGAELVDMCHARGVEVDAIPGPSAVTTALALSGFFAQRFAFLGFLPRKPGPLKESLAPFAESTLTLVLFESPNRIDKVLSVMPEVLGLRRYALCRELTKLHQQIWRGKLPELPQEGEVLRKGEFTVVVEGRRRGL